MKPVYEGVTLTHWSREDVLTIPNGISVLRLLMVPVFMVLLINEHDIAAVVILAFSGFTDWLDGVLARKLNQTSRLGQLLDPAADRLFIVVTLGALLWRGIVPWWLVIALVARELILGIALLLLSRRGLGPLPVHFLGKAGTFALLYAFPLLLLGSVDGWVGTVAWMFGWAFAGWGVLTYWWAAVLYLRQTVRLLQENN